MRKANLIQTAIWHDTDFVTRTVDAKLLYLLLLTQPDVSHVGVITLAASRWQRALGITPARFQKALRELVDTRFIVCDQDTDELLVRSWVKHNLSGSALEQAGKSHFAMVGSPLVRWVLQSEHPTLFGTPQDPLPQTPPPPHPSEAGYRDREGYREVVSSSSENEQARARVDAVWAEYHQRHPRSAYTPERRRVLRDWLDTYTPEMLVEAIVGNHLDPHCNGQNASGTLYHDFELIFRDSKHIERYAATARNGAPRPPAKSGAGQTFELLQREAAQLEQRNSQ